MERGQWVAMCLRIIRERKREEALKALLRPKDVV